MWLRVSVATQPPVDTVPEALACGCRGGRWEWSPRGVDLAREEGVLEVEVEHFELDDASAAHTAWFREQLLSAWRSPNGTVLLDQRAQRVVRASDTHPTPASAAMHRSKRAATGTGMVKQLPAFPTAPMSDVLEVREELSDERPNYRSVVRDLSDRLTASALDGQVPGSGVAPACSF